MKQFEYDPLNRLLSATGRESTQAAILPTWDVGVRNHDHTATNTYTRTYQFDKLGNVLKEQHTADGNPSNSFTKTFQYHATQEHNKLLSFTVGGTTYAHTYDANGNLLTETASRHHEWGYDDKLRLFRVEASGTPSKWAHYLYDSGGQRVKKVYHVNASTQHITVYIDGVYEHSYTKNSGTLDTDRNYNTLHVLDGTSRLASIQVGNDDDEPLDYPPIRYNVEDHLGNSCVELDGDGALINREEYYPFGDTSFGAFAKKRYRYNGKEKDGESGLYNYGMRYYAPWMCRFVSVDPLAGEYPHYTPYQYAGNKPINFVDLDGLEEGVKDGNTQPATDVSVDLAKNNSLFSVSESTNPGIKIIDVFGIVTVDRYEEAIMGGETFFSSNYGWVDATHAFTSTQRNEPSIGVEALWNQLINEPAPEQIHRGYYAVNYKQDIAIGPISIGIERQYLVKPGLSFEERKSVALAIFQDVSKAFEHMQGLAGSDSSFEPSDLPSNMLSFYRAVEGISENEIRELIQPLSPEQSLDVYRSYPGTFSDSQYKNYSFEPRHFDTPYTSKEFGIPDRLNTIQPASISTMKEFGTANLILFDQDMIRFRK